MLLQETFMNGTMTCIHHVYLCKHDAIVITYVTNVSTGINMQPNYLLSISVYHCSNISVGSVDSLLAVAIYS